MTRKIFRSILAAACAVLLASIGIIMGCLYDYFGGVQTQQLYDELSFAAVGVEKSGLDYLHSAVSDSSRLTWIAADGAVLYDDEADENTMENHADREEVCEALADGRGESVRYSKTLLEKTVYCAMRLTDGSVLRISVSRATMGVLLLGMLQPILLVVIVALLLALFLARGIARRIVQPLNELNLDEPLNNDTYDELAPLLTRISQQRRQISAQLRELGQKKDEFDQIIASMSEGLVLLDDKGSILSINAAAKALFRADDGCIGRDFLTIERSREIGEAMTRAMQSGHSEITIERGGRVYQLDVSRIESNGAAIGTVLLVFDVTERVDAERSRREFTANVSHELKTPLTAILGSSELLQSGLVKPADTARFVGHIHDEAARLLTLIEDIIRLSQLDEGVALVRETVDLAAVAAEAVRELEDKAAQSGVTLSLQAEPCERLGVPRLMHEIVYNLTENAIKYNRPDGRVDISVAADGTLTVADTGIGIPPEHQSRVFERFYRVDKSHSKQIGGTGLGLSIVKHAASYLGARIELESEEGKGTTIRVVFPA